MQICCGISIFIFSLVHSEFILNKKAGKNLQISTISGVVQGRKAVTRHNVTYWAFQGIPYAKPPLGNRRFRSPVPIDPWRGVLDATKEKSGCVQTYVDVPRGFEVNGQEDCLYLNVYSSRNPKTIRDYLPVLVWIYGGVFAWGNSSTKFYGIDRVLEQDIVLVNFNYRLGLLGFMSTGDLASPGNYGLKDQLLVLEWIQKNIKFFGGDKNRVTIFGHSAGAASVLYHMISPKSDGLFHRAIASSGSPLCSWAYAIYAKNMAFDIAEAAGIATNNTQHMVSRLRHLNIDVLNENTQKLLFVNLLQLDKIGFGFGPTIEAPHKEAFLTKSAFEALENGKFNKVPLLVGMTTLETTSFSDALQILRPLLLRYDLSPSSVPHPNMNIRTMDEKRKVGESILKHYLKMPLVSSSEEELLMYTTDDTFIRPITKTAQLMWKLIPVYLYLFSYASDYGRKTIGDMIFNRPKVKGVAHLEEQFYIWERPGINFLTEKDELVSSRVLKMWRNFMETGNPTPVKENLLQNIVWPPVNSSTNMVQLMIDEDLKLIHNYRREHLDFWEKLYRKYGHKPFLTY